MVYETGESLLYVMIPGGQLCCPPFSVENEGAKVGTRIDGGAKLLAS